MGLMDWSWETLGFPIPEVIVWICMIFYGTRLFKNPQRSRAKYNALCLVGTVYCLFAIAACAMIYVIEPVHIVLEVVACYVGLQIAHISEL